MSQFPIFCPLVFPSCRIANAIVRYGPTVAIAYRHLTTDEAVDEGASVDPAIVDLVADITAPFELRKLMVKFERYTGAAISDDAAYITLHFLKLTGGLPDDDWVEADFLAAEARMDAFWDAIDTHYPAGTILKQYRWYAVGPAIALSGEPRRVVERNLPGANVGNSVLPPQVAISVTERTSDAKSWGRFYLPASTDSVLTTDTGRLNATFQGALADAADVLYQGAITDGTPIVVYSTAKPVRETAGGTEMPATVARALAVTKLQVDDIPDVIRRRRWEQPTLRVQRDVSGA